MADLTIALLELLAHGSGQDANLAKAEPFCRSAQVFGADIALFPELMWVLTHQETAVPGREQQPILCGRSWLLDWPAGYCQSAACAARDLNTFR